MLRVTYITPHYIILHHIISYNHINLYRNAASDHSVRQGAKSPVQSAAPLYAQWVAVGVIPRGGVEEQFPATRDEMRQDAIG
jgi:hypothetical protein